MEDAHLTFQTQWMADRLLMRDENDGDYRGGLLSDVTYKFFATGYLLSTSMYSEVLKRWIPIQLTCIKGLKTAHYQSHFETLLKQIKGASMTPAEHDIVVRQVVDFLSAQKNGFITAYMSIFEKDYNHALSRLSGCEEHFCASITRIKRNHVIIKLGDQVCRDILKPFIFKKSILIFCFGGVIHQTSLILASS